MYMLSDDSMPGTTRYDLYSKVFGKDYVNYRKNIATKGSNYYKNVAFIENQLELPEGTITKQLTKENETLKKIFKVNSLPYPFQYSMDHGMGLAYAAGTKDKTIMKQAVETLLGTTHAQNQLLGMGGWEANRIKLIKQVKKDPSKLPELNEHMKLGYGNILPDQKEFYKVEGSGKNVKVTPLFTGQDQSTRFKNYVRQISTQPISAIKAAFPDKEVQNAILDFKKGKTKTLDKFLSADKTIPTSKFALPLVFGAPIVYGIGKEISEGRNPFSMSVQAAETGQINQDKSFIEEYPLLTGTAVAASPLVTKTGRKIYGALAKPLLKAFGSVPAATYFAGKELSKEDPNYAIAGADLLLPELGKRVAGSGTGIMSNIGRFLTNPIGRLARGFTPAGIALQGVELVNQAMKEQKRINEMRENDPEAYQQFIAEQEDMMGVSAASGGLIRKGFADGPEDPSKRKFMKIMGGLASLPIIGRFFDVVKEAAPVLDAVKTELASW